MEAAHKRRHQVRIHGESQAGVHLGDFSGDIISVKPRHPPRLLSNLSFLGFLDHINLQVMLTGFRHSSVTTTADSVVWPERISSSLEVQELDAGSRLGI